MEMELKLLYDKIRGRKMIKDFLDWHETLCWKYIDRFNLTDYQALWIAWAEGLILGLLLWWIF